MALGASYTIGTSVAETERWPNQLVDCLAGTVDLQLVANLGINGYASANLIGDELPSPGLPAARLCHGPHPSGAQYSAWVDLVAPVAERLLATR